MKNYHSCLFAFVFIAFIFNSFTSDLSIFDKRINKRITLDSLYKTYDSLHVKHKSYSIKFGCEIQSKGLNQSVKGNLRIAKDSMIWVSITPGFGIEVARLLLTPDSLFLLNRLKSSYQKAKISELKQLLHVDVSFYALQAILLNQLFHYPAYTSKLTDLKDFKLKAESSFYKLTQLNINDTLKQAETIFKLSSDFKLIETLVKFEQQKMQFKTLYSNFSKTDSTVFPHALQIAGVGNSKDYNLKFDFTKVEFDQQLEFPFRIPDSYQPSK